MSAIALFATSVSMIGESARMRRAAEQGSAIGVPLAVSAAVVFPGRTGRL
jgi:hypothetical protein